MLEKSIRLFSKLCLVLSCFVFWGNSTFANNNPGIYATDLNGVQISQKINGKSYLTICAGNSIIIKGTAGQDETEVKLIEHTGSGSALPITTASLPNWSDITGYSVGGSISLTKTFSSTGVYYFSLLSKDVSPGAGGTEDITGVVLIVTVQSPLGPGDVNFTINNTYSYCSGTPTGAITVNTSVSGSHDFFLYQGASTTSTPIDTRLSYSAPISSLDLENLFTDTDYQDLVAGQTYTIKHTMSNECGSFSMTKQFTVEGLTINVDDVVSCNPSFNPAIVATSVGAYTADMYYLYDASNNLITSNNSGVFVVAPSPGISTYTYYVQGEMNSGCVSDLEQVTVSFPHPQVNYADISFCAPGAVPVITPTITQIGGPATYGLYINGVFQAVNSTGVFLTDAADYTYGVNNCYVKINTASCGTTTKSFTVTKGQVPSFTMNDITICKQDIPATGLVISPSTYDVYFTGNFSLFVFNSAGTLITGMGGSTDTFIIPTSSLAVGEYTGYFWATDTYGCEMKNKVKFKIYVKDCPDKGCPVTPSFTAHFSLNPNNTSDKCEVKFTPTVTLGADWAIQSCTWDFGDSSPNVTTTTTPPPTVTHAFVSGVGGSTYLVCYTVEAYNVKTKEKCTKVVCMNVNVDCRNRKVIATVPGRRSATSQEAVELSSEVKVYPNPSTGVFAIDVDQLEEGTVVTVYDQTGRMVIEQELTNNTTEIDLSNKAKGLYLIRVQTQTETTTHKLIVK